VKAEAPAPLGRGSTCASLSIVLVLALFAHRALPRFGLMGWDSWPLVLTSRIDGEHPLTNHFTGELMQGRFPLGTFWRPLTSLTFALDHALWGTRALGYHLTDLLFFALTIAALHGLARRLMGAGWGSLLSVAFFAWSTVHLDILPVSSRRADSLSLLFTLCALCVLPRADRPRLFSRAGLAGLCVLAAAGSKETGLIAFPLVAALAILESRGAGARAALRRASSCGWPALAAALVFVASRTAVLGGLGGYARSSLADLLTRWPALTAHYAGLILLPRPLLGGLHADDALRSVLLGILVLAVGWTAWRARDPLALFLLGWVVALGGVTGIAGGLRPWYALPFLPAVGLGLGFLLQRGLAELRASTITGSALLTVVALLFAAPMISSPVLSTFGVWERLSVRQEQFLASLREQLEDAQPGAVFEVPDLPTKETLPLKRAEVYTAMGMTDYSVAAWLELAYPQREVELEILRQGNQSPRPRLRVRVVR
jgi:hypothetical protein